MADGSNVAWETCAKGGCVGARLPSRGRCLAHADAHNLSEAFQRLGEHGDLDARGVAFTAELLRRVLDAAPHDDEGHPVVTGARFAGASFKGGAGFAKATFQGDAGFGGATFQGGAGFAGATFTGGAGFAGAIFKGGAGFAKATFQGDAGFAGATFTGGAGFAGATFTGRRRVRRGHLHGLRRVRQGDLHELRPVRQGDLHQLRPVRLGDVRGVDDPGLAEAESAREPVEQSRATKDDGHDVKLDVVNEAGSEALTSDIGAAAERHDAIARRHLRDRDSPRDALDEHELDRAIDGADRRAMGHHDVRDSVGSVVPAIGVFARAEGAAAQQEGAGLLHELVDDGLAGVRGVEVPVMEASV
jgi:hypothetical protein